MAAGAGFPWRRAPAALAPGSSLHPRVGMRVLFRTVAVLAGAGLRIRTPGAGGPRCPVALRLWAVQIAYICLTFPSSLTGGAVPWRVSRGFTGARTPRPLAALPRRRSDTSLYPFAPSGKPCSC